MEITDIQGCVTLHNNVEMPYFGLGVFKSHEGEEVINAVKYALEIGYRHIDTASMYNNEKGVGIAIKQSNIKREDVFITSKVWNSDQGYKNTIKAFNNSLKKLALEYLDLYLIHWPVIGLYKETWKALEYLYKKGKIKAIGVSNFLINHLEELLKTAEIVPMVNQVEFHPYLIQQNLLDFCAKNNIQFEAWAPLMRGNINKVDLINTLAKKYNKNPFQVVLRWNLQKGVVTIPKSSKPVRIHSNAQIFDFEISPEDVFKIDRLDKNERIIPYPA